MNTEIMANIIQIGAWAVELKFYSRGFKFPIRLITSARPTANGK